ncbi:penicillin-binding protein 2 [Candidatus Dojkabacteria bacterium]|jgi:cell division protein FtsI/penicillin-binding protein 2|nr:penicillin-binding protein 2 [Candidatus Dojkabacteria bacterium]
MNIIRRKRTANKEIKHKYGHFIIVGVIISVIGVGVLVQAFRWQIIQGDKYASLAKSQYGENQDIASNRGTISARDGTVLAVDEPAFDVYASLSSLPDERSMFFENKEKYVATVSGILGVDKAELSKNLTDSFMYVKIKEGIDSDQKTALATSDIFQNSNGDFVKGFGFYFVKREKRVYPNGRLASHILGFIGKDASGADVGQYGIEGFYFSDLTGKTGYTYEEKDSLGNVILTSEYDPVLPREGKNFVLTINPAVQLKVEKALKKGVHDTQSKSGSVIIMNPKTGEILAMANYPDYNPNEYWKVTDNSIFRNKAVADVYEYGSIQKPITESIALESGKVKTDYICNDATGKIKLYDRTLYTWDKNPDGKLSLSGILEKSNNPCAAQVALATGHTYYYPKLIEFGIGKFIGIGLQDEASGYLKPFEMWTKLDLAVTAFGQSISATALQIISAESAIANGGVRMRPYIISQVTEGDDIIKITPKVIANPISAKTAQTVAKYMSNVVKKGDPRLQFAAYLPDYSIAGKTGTAQIPKKNAAGYYDDKTNTTFIGFSPVKDAKMIMIVRLEQPKSNPYAASTAVPVWITIFKDVANDLEIPKI